MQVGNFGSQEVSASVLTSSPNHVADVQTGQAESANTINDQYEVIIENGAQVNNDNDNSIQMYDLSDFTSKFTIKKTTHKLILI